MRIAYDRSPSVLEFVKQVTGSELALFRRVIIDIQADNVVTIYTVGWADEKSFEVGLPDLELAIEEVDAKEA